MLWFCFPLSCHLFEMVFIPPLLEATSLVPKLGRCIVATDYYLNLHDLYVKSPLSHAVLNAPACYLLNLVRYVQHTLLSVQYPQWYPLGIPYPLGWCTLKMKRKLYHLFSLCQMSKHVVLSCQMWQCPFYTLQIAPSVVCSACGLKCYSKQCLSSQEYLNSEQ